MGDEPYAALLPWIVFAVVDRAHGGGPLWAGIGALITAVACSLTSSRIDGLRHGNVIVLGAIVWFAGLAVAGALTSSDTGFVADNGRALSAAGFASSRSARSRSRPRSSTTRARTSGRAVGTTRRSTG